MLKTLALLGVLVFSANLAFGQESETADFVVEVKEFTAEEVRQLKDWLEDSAVYAEWAERYKNKAMVPKTFFDTPSRPNPPVWLATECAQMFGGEGLLVEACDLLREAGEDWATKNLRRSISRQDPIKTRILQRVHFGCCWPLIKYLNTFNRGGVFETHLTLMKIKRFQINSPGIVLMWLPDGIDGRRSKGGGDTFKFGIDIGISFRLTKFKVPGTDKEYLLHLNMVNAVPFGGNVLAVFRGGVGVEAFGMAGLSVTLP